MSQQVRIQTQFLSQVIHFFGLFHHFNTGIIVSESYSGWEKLRKIKQVTTLKVHLYKWVNMQKLKCSLFYNSSPFLNLSFPSLKITLKMSFSLYRITFYIPALTHMYIHLHERVHKMFYYKCPFKDISK